MNKYITCRVYQQSNLHNNNIKIGALYEIDLHVRLSAGQHTFEKSMELILVE